MSAIITGTPAALSCSAITCSDLVLPVPVAPAASPWRLTVASGMRTAGGGIGGAVDDHRPEFERLALDRVAGGDLLGGRGRGLCADRFQTLLPETGSGSPQMLLRLLLSAVREELVWIDCEMTGLDLGKDRLIEIAALVTDGDLNVLGDGVDVVIRTDEDALSGMVEVVTQMHTRSGLIDEVRSSTIDLPQAEAMVLDYVKAHVPQAKTAPLAGNSIATDRGFIARDMPALDDYLHYRMVDVSSIKELCRRWYPRIYFGQPEKGLTHRALADIHESIRELQFYRRTAFVPPPGPSTSEIAAMAGEINGGTGASADIDSAPEATSG